MFLLHLGNIFQAFSFIVSAIRILLMPTNKCFVGGIFLRFLYFFNQKILLNLSFMWIQQRVDRMCIIITALFTCVSAVGGALLVLVSHHRSVKQVLLSLGAEKVNSSLGLNLRSFVLQFVLLNHCHTLLFQRKGTQHFRRISISSSGR